MIFLVGTDDKRVTVADGNYIATQYFEFFETFGIHRAIPISILNKACHMHGEHPDKTFEIVTRYSYDLAAEWPRVKTRLEGFLDAKRETRNVKRD